MWQILAPFRLLYKIYFAIVFVAVGIILYPIFKILVQRKEWNHITFFLQKYLYVGLLQLFLFIWIRTKGKNNLPEKAGVIVANHTSFFDIVASYRAFDKRKFAFLAKQEIRKMPFVATFFNKNSINITVERGNKVDGAVALEKMSQRIDEGYHAIIYPEGTRSKFAPVMKEFKTGAFRLAIQKQVAVIPVTYLDNWQILGDPKKIWGWARPGATRVIIHEPIETKGMTEEDLVPLLNRVREIIENDLKKAHPKYFK